ncbi:MULTISPECIES: GTP-binding protein [Streptomyces]|uniref:GTP-binding protein n=1 Tax=Streptomyces TaxID=1883 RepID=UPI00058BE050|nr:ATP/GTP-binding protein [Streptomyces sp. SCSIO ZS0520]
MAFASSRSRPDPAAAPDGPAYLPSSVRNMVKLVVAGGLGVGKTTLIRSVSETRSLHTEEVMTAPSSRVDSLAFTPEKTHTTVTMDFGRLTLGESGETVLYLFGTPGQARFRQAWLDTAYGARGALVLMDLRRPEVSYEAMDLVEESGMPYAVAVNDFPGSPVLDAATVRADLDLHPETPLLFCNALERESSIDALIGLVSHSLDVYRRNTGP